MGEGLEMDVIHKINGRTVTDGEWEASLQRSRKMHKAAGTTLSSGQAYGGKGGWPLHSDALAVWPSQVREAEAHARKIGVPTSFDPKTGKCILRDRSHRAKYLKANGVCDKDGGYKET